MQLVVSDGIPRPAFVDRVNQSWAPPGLVEATIELQQLLCQDRPRWDPRIGQEGLVLAQRDQEWLARCEPVVPRPAKFHWSTQCRAVSRRKRRQPARGSRVRGDWDVLVAFFWYFAVALGGAGVVIGFAAVGISIGCGLFVLLVPLWALVRSTGLADWHVGYRSYRFLKARSHRFGIRTTWGGRTPRTVHRQREVDRIAKGGRPRLPVGKIRRVTYGGHLSCEAQRWEVTRQFIQQMSVRGGGTPREQGIGQGMGEGPDRYATPA